MSVICRATRATWSNTGSWLAPMTPTFCATGTLTSPQLGAWLHSFAPLRYLALDRADHPRRADGTNRAANRNRSAVLVALDRVTAGRDLDRWLDDIGEHRLGLQLDEREVIGNLAQDLRQRCAEGRADGSEQFR